MSADIPDASDVGPVDPDDVALALDVALAAGAVTLDWFDSPGLRIDRKPDGTPVTQADTEAEALVRARLVEERPDDSVIGEEHDDRPGGSGRRWIVDPIDGTRSFARGVPLFATLVALDDAAGSAVGVIHLPALDETIWGVRGGGCWWNGEPARVSSTADLAGGYVMTSAVDHWPLASLQPFLAGDVVLRTWGDAYGYALVATGRAEAMIDPVVNVWDVAPMPVILAEAGGRFTDVDGVVRNDGGSGIASNGLVHDQVLRRLRGQS